MRPTVLIISEWPLLGVEQDKISSEVVRNEVDVQKTDANATGPVKVTYADAVKGNTESKQVKRVKFVSPLTLKI